MKKILILTFFVLSILFSHCANVDRSTSTSSKGVTCYYNNRTYEEGDEIKVPGDVCLFCECRKGWKRPNEHSCARIDCPFENEDYADCGLKYIEGRCCPEFICPSTNPENLDIVSKKTPKPF